MMYCRQTVSDVQINLCVIVLFVAMIRNHANINQPPSLHFYFVIPLGIVLFTARRDGRKISLPPNRRQQIRQWGECVIPSIFMYSYPMF